MLRAFQAGQALATGADHAALRAIAAELTPQPVEAVIVQADMTVLAPGPLPAALSHILGRFADLESPGLASVYRLSAQSLRRGLDSRLSAADIHQFFQAHALGTIPETVRVLIDDAAHTHGALHGGPASSYLTSPDPAELKRGIDSEAGRAVGLKLIAPTVAISPAPLATVISALAEAGIHATAVDASGRSIDLAYPTTTVTTAKRAPGSVKRSPFVSWADSGSTPASASATALALAQQGATHPAAGAAVAAAPDPEPGLEENATILRTAARAQRSIIVEFADSSGKRITRTLRPLRVEAGEVYATSQGADGNPQVVRFPLHRVVGLHNDAES